MKSLLLILALACYSLVSAQAPDGFTLVPPTEFRGDPAIQASLDFGAQQVIRQGKERNLPNERYQISRVISVYKLVEDETDYQFTVQLTGDQGSVVDATYMVSVSGGNTREVTSYEYSVQGTDITGSSEDGDGEEEEDMSGGWTELDLSEVENDPEILAILDFGVQNITQQEIAAGKIPDGTYKVERIRSAFSQVVAGTNYRFDVDITDDKGLVLRATLIVYEPLDGSNEVTSYAYIVTATDLPEGSTSVDPSELDTNQELRAALDNGVASIVQQLTSAHQLPESTYSVMEVNSIYAQGATDNRFDVSLRNCAGLIARVVFTVSGSQEATLGSLNITSIPEEGLIGGDC